MRGDRIAHISSTPVVQEVTPQETVVDTLVPHRSGRVIVSPNRYTLLEESYDVIPDEQRIDPRNYNEELKDKDAEF